MAMFQVCNDVTTRVLPEVQSLIDCVGLSSHSWPNLLQQLQDIKGCLCGITRRSLGAVDLLQSRAAAKATELEGSVTVGRLSTMLEGCRVPPVPSNLQVVFDASHAEAAGRELAAVGYCVNSDAKETLKHSYASDVGGPHLTYHRLLLPSTAGKQLAEFLSQHGGRKALPKSILRTSHPIAVRQPNGSLLVANVIVLGSQGKRLPEDRSRARCSKSARNLDFTVADVALQPLEIHKSTGPRCGVLPEGLPVELTRFTLDSRLLVDRAEGLANRWSWAMLHRCPPPLRNEAPSGAAPPSPPSSPPECVSPTPSADSVDLGGEEEEIELAPEWAWLARGERVLFVPSYMPTSFGWKDAYVSLFEPDWNGGMGSTDVTFANWRLVLEWEYGWEQEAVLLIGEHETVSSVQATMVKPWVQHPLPPSPPPSPPSYGAHYMYACCYLERLGVASLLSCWVHRLLDNLPGFGDLMPDATGLSAHAAVAPSSGPPPSPPSSPSSPPSSPPPSLPPPTAQPSLPPLPSCAVGHPADQVPASRIDNVHDPVSDLKNVCDANAWGFRFDALEQGQLLLLDVCHSVAMDMHSIHIADGMLAGDPEHSHQGSLSISFPDMLSTVTPSCGWSMSGDVVCVSFLAHGSSKRLLRRTAATRALLLLDRVLLPSVPDAAQRTQSLVDAAHRDLGVRLQVHTNKCSVRNDHQLCARRDNVSLEVQLHTVPTQHPTCHGIGWNRRDAVYRAVTGIIDVVLGHLRGHMRSGQDGPPPVYEHIYDACLQSEGIDGTRSVVTVDDDCAMVAVLQALVDESEGILGIDMEWTSEGPAVIQLASRATVVVTPLVHHHMLLCLLCDRRIIKVIKDGRQDWLLFAELCRTAGIALATPLNACWVELADTVPFMHRQAPTDALTRLVLGSRWTSNDEFHQAGLSHGDWGAWPLPQLMLRYCALDACVCVDAARQSWFADSGLALSSRCIDLSLAATRGASSPRSSRCTDPSFAAAGGALRPRSPTESHLPPSPPSRDHHEHRAGRRSGHRVLRADDTVRDDTHTHDSQPHNGCPMEATQLAAPPSAATAALLSAVHVLETWSGTCGPGDSPPARVWKELPTDERDTRMAAMRVALCTIKDVLPQRPTPVASWTEAEAKAVEHTDVLAKALGALFSAHTVAPARFGTSGQSFPSAAKFVYLHVEWAHGALNASLMQLPRDAGECAAPHRATVQAKELPTAVVLFVHARPLGWTPWEQFGHDSPAVPSICESPRMSGRLQEAVGQSVVCASVYTLEMFVSMSGGDSAPAVALAVDFVRSRSAHIVLEMADSCPCVSSAAIALCAAVWESGAEIALIASAECIANGGGESALGCVREAVGVKGAAAVCVPASHWNPCRDHRQVVECLCSRDLALFADAALLSLAERRDAEWHSGFRSRPPPGTAASVSYAVSAACGRAPRRSEPCWADDEFAAVLASSALISVPVRRRLPARSTCQQPPQVPFCPRFDPRCPRWLTIAACHDSGAPQDSTAS